MDTSLLTAHLFGVALLFVMISIELVALYGAPRATSVGQLRAALYAGPAIERIAPVATLLIAGTGLWMVARMSWIGFGDAWVVLAIVVTLALAVVGNVVQGRRLAAIGRVAGTALDGEVPAELAELTRDPVLHTAGWGSTGAAFAFLWLMVDQPGAIGAILAFVVGPAIGIAIGQVLLSRAATPAIADSGRAGASAS
ncbi:hypothetical protein [Nocardioides terrisoli]|uniref:hypothetical protein n=1 Tax=Nocardioides terrisoli TaxID=3388267 RepID=UPI00287B71D2|nr:hypothetical protein [Nocardioides marmorisolisilvae]